MRPGTEVSQPARRDQETNVMNTESHRIVLDEAGLAGNKGTAAQKFIESKYKFQATNKLIVNRQEAGSTDIAGSQSQDHRSTGSFGRNRYHNRLEEIQLANEQRLNQFMINALKNKNS